MKIEYISFAIPNEKYIIEGCNIYKERIGKYIDFEHKMIPALKNAKSLTTEQQKIREGEIIIQKISKADFIILLDEKGKDYTTIEFSKFVENKMICGFKKIIFISGGPYGFSNQVKEKANTQLALSKMTFSHLMVQLFFLEQLYRIFTIMKNEPYHHI